MANSPLIVANWKMYHTVEQALQWLLAFRSILDRQPKILEEIVIAPPFTALYSLAVGIQETPLKLAGQNCSWEEEGAFTGEISPVFLKNTGCEYVILGHSERRHLFKETDQEIQQKVSAALKADLKPILCIGETLEERKSNRTIQVIEQQLRQALEPLGTSDLQGFVVAYEPVWAIGTGETAKLEQISEVHRVIRHMLMRLFDSPTALGVRIIYGGSVKAGNALDILEIPDVDGVLVGSASLNPHGFAQIAGLA